MTREEFAERIATKAIELLDSEQYVQLSRIYRHQPELHDIPRSPERKSNLRKNKARLIENWVRPFADKEPADNLALHVGRTLVEILNGQLYNACRAYTLACTIPGVAIHGEGTDDGMQVALNLLKLVLEEVEGKNE